MPYTKEVKILINNLLDLKGYNGKHLVKRVSQQRLERRPCLPVISKAMGFRVGQPLFWQQQLDDAAPAQLITLILLTTWCYIKMARREIIFVQRTEYYDLIVYKELSTLVHKCQRYSKPKQTVYSMTEKTQFPGFMFLR